MNDQDIAILIQQLQAEIIRIRVKCAGTTTSYPYTLITSKYSPIEYDEIKQQLNIDNYPSDDELSINSFDPFDESTHIIKVFNLAQKRIEDLHVYTIQGVNKYVEPSIKRELELCVDKENLVDRLYDPNTCKDKHLLRQLVYTDYLDIESIGLMCAFKFKIPVEQFINIENVFGTESDPVEIFKEAILDLMTERAGEIVIDLEQLKQITIDNGGSQDDIDDADVMINMFKTLPEELSLDGHETISSMIKSWPPLLQPSPFFGANLDVIDQIDNKIKTQSRYIKIISILESMDSKQELHKILDELKDKKAPASIISLVDNRLVDIYNSEANTRNGDS